LQVDEGDVFWNVEALMQQQHSSRVATQRVDPFQVSSRLQPPPPPPPRHPLQSDAGDVFWNAEALMQDPDSIPPCRRTFQTLPRRLALRVATAVSRASPTAFKNPNSARLVIFEGRGW
jgi:hypothetical protein